ncbi:MAG: NarK family nitrate/nitrite MFS transporter [Oscillatoriaceae cyanobacterium Prado104]|jgi:NNP family nitrate/nitrite transporter-like MFS transporter|nr:NarK family nitrate/nitrite MFS transporter [Oscillatoriaceae cyanobacterium Prado104]
MLKDLLSFRGRYRILHLTWLAFFLTFFIWFNFVPFKSTIQADFGLSEVQIRTLLICNVALTVPARIVIGMLLDKYGPRITYSLLLIFAAFPCVSFAMAQNFNQLVLSRLAISIVGAGFVVGIRMVAEWFPPKEIGIAEGIYGGWGNFGSAGAAMTLPTIALLLGMGATNAAGDPILNWRLAIAITGILTGIYGCIYFCNVQDCPEGKVYQRAKKVGGLEVTSKRDFWLLLAMNVPLVGILAVLAWRLSKVGFLSGSTLVVIYVALIGLYLFQAYGCWQVNKDLMLDRKHYPPEDRYRFSQVMLLELTYFANFGSELAVVSMLPAFFQDTFSLGAIAAGWIASSYAFMNLMSRPGGGLISDRMGSRKGTMTVLSAGIGIGYLCMGWLNGNWWLPVAVAVTMAGSFFVQAGEGSTYAIVPLIKRRLTGQIAGNVGAYGNVGAVAYLTIFSLLPAWLGGGTEPSAAVLAQANTIFFQILGVSSMMVTFLCWFFLKEPKGSFAETYESEQPSADSHLVTVSLERPDRN